MTNVVGPWGGRERHRRRTLETDPLALDTNTAERILRGVVSPDDAPPGYSGVTLLLAALRTAPSEDEVERPTVAVAAIVGRLVSAATGAGAGTSSQLVEKRRFRVVTAALVSGVVVFGGVAAAGALPGPAQRLTADVLDKIGVTIPTPESNADSPGGSGMPGADTNPAGTSGGKALDPSHHSQRAGLDTRTALPSGASSHPSVTDPLDPGTAEPGGSAEVPGHAPAVTPSDGGTGPANTALGGKSPTGTRNPNSNGHAAASPANS